MANTVRRRGGRGMNAFPAVMFVLTLVLAAVVYLELIPAFR